MFCRFFVYLCFTFFLVFASALPKHKKTKNIIVVPLGLFLCFLALVCLKKIQKEFSLFVFALSACFKKSKTPKIFVVLLWFCEVRCRVQRSSVEFGLMLLFKPHK